MLACVVTLWPTRTYDCIHLLVVLLWCCRIAVGCAVATTASLVHEETEETKKWKIYTFKYVEKTRTRKYTKRVYSRKQRKAGKVQQVIDGGGVQVGTWRGQGGANRARSDKKSKSILRVPVQQSLAFYFRTVYSLQAVLSTDVQEQQYSSSFDHNTVLRAATAVSYTHLTLPTICSV